MTHESTVPKRLNVFERYLTLWVALCMLAGVLLGKLIPGFVGTLRGLEFGKNSQINLPIAVLSDCKTINVAVDEFLRILCSCDSMAA